MTEPQRDVVEAFDEEEAAEEAREEALDLARERGKYKHELGDIVTEAVMLEIIANRILPHLEIRLHGHATSIDTISLDFDEYPRCEHCGEFTDPIGYRETWQRIEDGWRLLERVRDEDSEAEEGEDNGGQER